MFKSRKAKVISAFVVIVIGGYLIVQFTNGSGGVPQKFTDARLQGALIAQDIVNLSNQSTDDLKQVNELDKEGNYTKALSVTTDLVAQSEDIRNKAVSLSGEVAQMTQSLSGISNFEAQQAALESISNRLALINQLINYSGDLEQLLDTLRNRFTGTGGSSVQVQTLVNQINTDINAINNFNSQASQDMNQFDSILGR